MGNFYFATQRAARSATYFFALLLATITWMPVALAQTASFDPGRHQVGVYRSALVQATFNAALNPTTISGMKVYGNHRYGLKAGSYASSPNAGFNNRRIVFNPDSNFAAGELITVSLLASVKALGGTSVTKSVTQFWTETSGGGSFASGTLYSQGTGAKSPSVGDIDGDGFPDLASCNPGANSLHFRLNDGSGGFTNAYTLGGLSAPQQVQLIDADLDGDMDLVVTNTGASQLRIYPNNGSGSFGTAVNVSLGAQPQTIALADLDADADLDVVSLGADSTIQVMLSTGTLTYSAATDYALPAKCTGVAIGDYDKDGDLDVFTACDRLNLVYRFANDGNGVLAGALSTAVGANPQALYLADVDTDQDLDLLTANEGGTVSLCKYATGDFGSASSINVGSQAKTLVLGDIDGDLDLDLLVPDYAANNIALRLNDGSGNFSGTTTFGSVANSTGIALGDLNGDGALDVAATSSSNNNMRVMPNIIPAPVIKSLTATSGIIGSSFQIFGQHFTRVSSVTINGVATTYTVNSPNYITVTVPEGASSGQVRVTTAYGNRSTAYTVLPTFSTFSPTSGTEVASVVLTGTAFVNVTDITFNGVSATSYTVNSSTQITVSVPVGATTGNIVVTTASGSVSNGSFTVLPFITGFSPVKGAEGTQVLLEGSSFTSATNARFGGVTASSFTVLSDTRAYAVVPTGAVAGLIQVYLPGLGWRSSSSSFALQPGITSFTPGGGTTGTQVVIRGTRLSGTTWVKFGSTPASSFVVNSNTQVTATVATGTSSGYIRVKTGEDSGSSSTAFAVQPTLTGFSPDSGRYNTAITLTGTNLLGTTQVTFNGVAATFTVSSNTSLTAYVPAAAVSGSIVVTNAAGTATSAGSFLVLPGIISFNPGYAQAGEPLYVNCSGLANVTSVKFNGTTASFAKISSTLLRAYVPSGATSGYVTLSSSGRSCTSPMPFQVRVSDVVAVSPARNATGQSSGVDLRASLGSAPTSSPLIRLHSSLKGLLSGSTAGTSGLVTQLNPDSSLPAGDLLNATVQAASAGVWQFRTAATGTGQTVKYIDTVRNIDFSLAVTMGDIDNDGDLDVISGGQTCCFRTYFNDGDGTYTAGTLVSTSQAHMVRLADMDNDGDLDVVISLRSGNIQVFTNANTSFTSRGIFSVPSTSFYKALDVGDIDGDGDMDVVVTGKDNFTVCYNDGTGSLSVGWKIPAKIEGGETFVVLRDMDVDGDLDVVYNDFEKVSVHLNPGHGAIDTAASYTFYLPSQGGGLLVEDFDNDGDLDIISGTRDGGVYLFRNNGSLSFTVTAPLTKGSYFLQTGDMDADGDLDLLVGDAVNDTVFAYKNNGTAGFTSLFKVPCLNCNSGVTGDLDRDGDIDFVGSTFGCYCICDLRLLVQNGLFSTHAHFCTHEVPSFERI